MPLVTQERGEAPAPGTEAGAPAPRRTPSPLRLDVGIVNNMPDAAMATTERQFGRLLAAASGEVEVTLHLFSLDEVPRGSPARRAMAGRYGDLAALERSRLDGLIVTGAEPVAANLAEEPYWDALTRVVDWAEGNTASTIWSCLAAHAAVLHLDGIARRRLPRKRSGVYACAAASAGGLLDGMAAGLSVPHSRWNDLAEDDLVTHGYTIESRSAEAGVDCFTKPWGSRFVFLQGHPEYDRDTLFREYRRDVQRYLGGERDAMPAVPAHYFDPATESRIAFFEREAQRRREPGTWDAFPRDWAVRPAVAAAAASSAAGLYRNWIGTLVAKLSEPV